MYKEGKAHDSASVNAVPAQIPKHYVADFSDFVEVSDVQPSQTRRSSLWREAWKDMYRRPMFWLSAVIIFFVLLSAIFPTLFTSVDPRYCTLSNSNKGPSAGHILGFTKQGCDIYARIIHGTSTSVSVGFLSVLITFVLGLVFGALSGFFGGWVDSLLSRIGDILFSVPYILAAVVIMSVFANHRNVLVISLAIGAFAWPVTARILRAEILRVKNSEYVHAALALGLTPFRTLIMHILPNSIAPVLVVTTLSLSGAIVAEASLSFLGVGLPSGQFVSWGGDISQGQTDLRTAPQNLIYPSIALAICVFGFIILGEVVRDALDPKARAKRS